MKLYQAQSLHFFHSFAVLDRVDTSGLSDLHHHTCHPSPRFVALYLLPSKEDDAQLKTNFTVLVSRVLTEFFHFFKTSFSDVVQYHIFHPHEIEISLKSGVVR